MERAGPYFRHEARCGAERAFRLSGAMAETLRARPSQFAAHCVSSISTEMLLGAAATTIVLED